jgi:putative addiction module component (TIGR02574 family)
MNTTTESTISSQRITELALGLTPIEQSVLLAELHENLESIGRGPDLDAAWGAEIERRVREVENGTAELFDHEVVMKEARELLARK